VIRKEARSMSLFSVVRSLAKPFEDVRVPLVV
jgi:hypothetical protein